jgi:hypothetical protein
MTLYFSGLTPLRLPAGKSQYSAVELGEANRNELIQNIDNEYKFSSLVAKRSNRSEAELGVAHPAGKINAHNSTEYRIYNHF